MIVHMSRDISQIGEIAQGPSLARFTSCLRMGNTLLSFLMRCIRLIEMHTLSRKRR